MLYLTLHYAQLCVLVSRPQSNKNKALFNLLFKCIRTHCIGIMQVFIKMYNCLSPLLTKHTQEHCIYRKKLCSRAEMILSHVPENQSYNMLFCQSIILYNIPNCEQDLE